MKLKVSRLAISVGLMVTSLAAYADAKEEAVIDKAVAAYGGDALLQLETLRINDTYKGFREGQSRIPSEIDQVSYQTSTTIDFKNSRKSMQSVGGVYVQGLYVQHAFFNGEKGYRIQHTAQTSSEDPWTSFARADRGLSWRLDIALVKLLADARTTATYKGEDTHRGKPQHLLAFKPEGYPEFTLYVDKASGLISKMTRPGRKPDSFYSYVFSDYQKRGGFTFAADTYVMHDGKPDSLTVSRSLDFNADIDDAYTVPETYGTPAKMLDDSEMAVRRLADGVYHAGKNGGFSIFVDAGDYLIASGGYPGLEDRFNAVKAFAGTNKPLRYQIVTHHHDDHIAGLKDAARLGATFIVAEEHIDAVRAAVPTDLGTDRFLIAGDRSSYGKGLVEVVDIASWHANHNLVTYIPHAKLAFSADHFFSFAENGLPAPAEMYAEFKAALDGYGLDIKQLAAVHSGRVLSYEDLVQSSTGPFTRLECPAFWDFCS
ncbi:hypothetical protein ACFO5Q_11595 [Kordiimonas lipolytica]|uniref:Metallo-beta-lactamase domain-containing protein n=1 Tax=Kordiimonas lipolytica TaxID=1662421 RepID=A0ABV8UBD9_9PROT|nr:hypothetical protein [Kordiimonas lipolytica]